MNFWKKWIVAAVALLLLLGMFGGCGKEESFVWKEILLNEQLPAPFTEKGTVHSNTTASLWMDLHGVDSSEFNSYALQCQAYGYSIDVAQSTYTFDAYNQEGYKLNLFFADSSKKLTINLEEPMQMSALNWPINALCEFLPKPASTQGNVKWDTDTHLLVYLAAVDADAFAEYTNACAEAGFNLKHSKSEKTYHAENANGYRLSLRCEGFNILSIDIKAPSSNNETPVSTTTTVNSSDGEGYRSDFKKAMDEYEKFMDEYIAFMKKYKNSNGTDPSLLTDYVAYVSDYAEMVDAFEAWESEELSDAEVLYYAEVQSRITKKLLEIAM